MYIAYQSGRAVTLGAHQTTGKARGAARLAVRSTWMSGPRSRRLGCPGCDGNCGKGMGNVTCDPITGQCSDSSSGSSGGGLDWGSILPTLTVDAANFATAFGLSQQKAAQAAAPYTAALNYQKQLLALQQQAAAAAAKTGAALTSPGQLISGISNTTLLLLAGGALLITTLAR